MATDKQIQQIQKILVDWNPLGSKASLVKDLNGYDTEAIDIVGASKIMNKGKCNADIIRSVLEDAFDLSLDEKQCQKAATEINEILNK